MSEAKEETVSQEVRPPKFLVCVDQAEETRVALRYACIKAKKLGGVVDLLHVIEPGDFQSLFAVAEKARAERREAAEAMLQTLAEEANTFGIMPSLILREGVAGEEIVSAVLEDFQVSLLILGASKFNASRGKLVGWLTAQMGDKLLIPVIVVPSNLTDQQIEQLS